MKKADAQTLLTLMDELTELMTEYDRRTDRMVTNDLEVIQQVLLSRNELMDKMRQVKQSIMDIANAQVPAERELIRDILNNKPVTENLSYELRQLQSKMRHLHDIKSGIDEKDKKVTAVVRQSYEDVKAELEKTNNVEAATVVGTVVAKKALEKGITTVVYDRGGFVYEGKVKALAEAAREAGLEF